MSNIPTATAAPPHSHIEDVHALLMGSAFVSFGLFLLKAAGLVTGGLAGVALILCYLFGLPLGVVFVIINLPFFLLAQRKMGWTFTLKSIGAMIALAVMSLALPHLVFLTTKAPAFAAVFGGSLIGMGVLTLARHRASVGGVGILALYLQERRGFNAGMTSMMFDAVTVIASLFIVGPQRFGYSAISAVALNLVMIAYHRPGRYAGH